MPNENFEKKSSATSASKATPEERDQKRPSEEFDEVYPFERMKGLLIILFKEVYLKDLRKDYEDERGLIDGKLNLKVNEIKWKVKKKLEEQERRNDEFQVENWKKYIPVIVSRMLLEEQKSITKVSYVELDERDLQYLREKTGMPDLQLTESYIKYIQQVEGYENVIVSKKILCIRHNAIIQGIEENVKDINDVLKKGELPIPYCKNGKVEVYVPDYHTFSSSPETYIDLIAKCKKMNKRQRQVYRKFYCFGKSAEEIAEELNIKKSYVYQINHAILKKLLRD